MRIHLPLLPAVLGLLALASSAQKLELYTGASAAWEVPTNPSLACGSGNFTYDAATRVLSYDVQATGFATAVSAAHIHDGDVGVGGPIIVSMTGGPASWIGSSAPLSAAQEADLLREGFYVNIHTAAFGEGEIRGQIVAPTNFRSPADGSQMVPPIATSATAQGTYFLDQSTGALTYHVEAIGLSAPMSQAHIHDAPAGVPGPVAFPLVPTGAATWSGTTAPLSTAQKIDLLTEGLYLNIHTATYGGGEIRGQILVGSLNTDTAGLSVTNGCSQRLFLDAGRANAGANYWVVGTLSGTTPGVIAPGGLPVPVNPDFYFDHTIANPNSPPMTLSMSTLDGNGQGTCTFTFPAGAFPGLAGQQMHHAFALIDVAAAAVELTSNAEDLVLVP